MVPNFGILSRILDFCWKRTEFVLKFGIILMIFRPFFDDFMENMGNWDKIRTPSWFSIFVPIFIFFSNFFYFFPIFSYFFLFSPKICPEFIPNSEWFFCHKQPWTYFISKLICKKFFLNFLSRLNITNNSISYSFYITS